MSPNVFAEIAQPKYLTMNDDVSIYVETIIKRVMQSFASRREEKNWYPEFTWFFKQIHTYMVRTNESPFKFFTTKFWTKPSNPLHMYWKKTLSTPSGNCHSCGSLIEREASVVGDFNYHPSCFKCQGCERPLANEQYYIIEGGNYCNGCRDVSFRTMLLQYCILSTISWAETSTKNRLNQALHTRTYYSDK